MSKTGERILIGATIIAVLIAVAIPLTAMAAGSGHVDTFLFTEKLSSAGW